MTFIEASSLWSKSSSLVDGELRVQPWVAVADLAPLSKHCLSWGGNTADCVAATWAAFKVYGAWSSWHGLVKAASSTYSASFQPAEVACRANHYPLLVGPNRGVCLIR